MSSDDSIEQLRRDVEYLKDRQAIQDVVHRHSRGFDRHDTELMMSSYHDDAVARFGPRTITAAEYAEFMNTAHQDRFALHSHHITTHTCDIDGETAYAESYNIAAFLSPDMKRATYVSGRYLDELEKRDGQWRIAKRRAFIDLVIEGDATYFGVPRGRPIDYDQVWTRNDLSYTRPLDLETAGPQWH
jgi:ketosteroid isomerase-like protein